MALSPFCLSIPLPSLTNKPQDMRFGSASNCFRNSLRSVDHRKRVSSQSKDNILTSVVFQPLGEESRTTLGTTPSWNQTEENNAIADLRPWHKDPIGAPANQETSPPSSPPGSQGSQVFEHKLTCDSGCGTTFFKRNVYFLGSKLLLAFDWALLHIGKCMPSVW